MSSPLASEVSVDGMAHAIDALAQGVHGNPFALLGPHHGPDGGWRLRAWLPGAQRVVAVDAGRHARLVELGREHADGFFSAHVPRRRKPFAYRLKVWWPDATAPVLIDDPYRFGPILGDTDLWLLSEGTHQRPYERLGAHPVIFEGCAGATFAVWAPNAQRVSVVGDFNDWNEKRHPMRKRVQAGVWEIFLPGVEVGAHYKFAILGRDGAPLAWRADPYARASELRPATASVVAPPLLPAAARASAPLRKPTQGAPMAIYEVHLPSWRRPVEDGNRFLDWDQLAEALIDYVVFMGFTHIECMPVCEHPFDGSWGYQPVGLYAPSARFGPPEGLRRFIERAHAAGIGVLLDWVAGHFPADPHGLVRFDGAHLYEHADPREGAHPDWKTLIYNFGRHEVREFLIGNARYWIEEAGFDGIRVDAVASMLYRDYSREPGQWVPNRLGGRENLEAVDFLRRLNEELGASHPLALTIAEESTSWPGVSRPTAAGGLGFHYKWNMGWMNDTLRYIARDPAHRRFHQNELTFGLLYAFDEQFILPVSHDEVVHGKGSLLTKMPGDRWQRFANVRLYLSFMYAHPGKKLLFMGCEFAQEREWSHDQSLDWRLLEDPAHRGVQSLVRDLNRLHRELPALHELDCQHAGFDWISHAAHEDSMLAFERRGLAPAERVIAVCNFTPVPRTGVRIGVTPGGAWRECFNSDSAHYGGSDAGNTGARLAPETVAAHGRAASLVLTLPPLAVVLLQWVE